MKNIQLLNKISKVGTDVFTSDYVLGDNIQNPDGIMVRSAVMHEMTFAPELKAIARAGAGVNNIPVDECAKQGIVVFNTPGANANGVKELTIAALLLASRDIYGGITWANSLKGSEGVAKAVEKGKSAFAGVEIMGKTLGVIGLGAIGRLVANAAVALGMNVVGCDPFLSAEAAKLLDPVVSTVATFEDVFKACDYLTVHVPATKDTKGMINNNAFNVMKDGVRIVNLSRAELVDSADMIAAVESGKVASYVTDFPTDEMVGIKGIVTIPHLGASTEEAEDNCAKMAAAQLIDYLENGNIKNSVNYPALVLDREGLNRVAVLHCAESSAAAAVTATLAENGIVPAHFMTATKGAVAYTVADFANDITPAVTEKLAAVEGVIRVLTF